jgi:hypothetical protein
VRHKMVRRVEYLHGSAAPLVAQEADVPDNHAGTGIALGRRRACGGRTTRCESECRQSCGNGKSRRHGDEFRTGPRSPLIDQGQRSGAALRTRS